MKYFTINELCRSSTASLRGIDNTPTEEIKRNLTTLVDRVLDPLREAWGKPLVISSGYRCPELNKAVGGSRTSHHMRGMAADLDTGNRVENRKLYQLVLSLNLPFTQLIDERNFDWIHISLDPANVKRQQLKL